jgi:hypothetical protein
MKHWYVVKKSNSDSLKVGDVIGFSRQNPNIKRLVNGHFLASAEWIYIGRWEIPPIDELMEAMDLVREQLQTEGKL